MGFGVSGASAVIFLGLFVAAGTLYATASNAGELVSDAAHDDRERLLDRQNTAINVTDATYDTGEGSLDVTVENTGTHALSVDATTVLVDNAYVSTENATVDGATGTDLWTPGTTLRLSVTLDAAPDRAKVVTETGVADAAAVTVRN